MRWGLTYKIYYDDPSGGFGLPKPVSEATKRLYQSLIAELEAKDRARKADTEKEMEEYDRYDQED